MKRNHTILSVMLCLLPIVLGVILWDKLPEQVPVHFNTTGAPDNYAPKALAVFGLPVLIAVIDVIVLFITKKDPKAERHSKIMLYILYWCCPVISNVAMSVTLLIAIGKDIPIGMIIDCLVGLLFVMVGNYLPKCKQNYTIGIKLPWTLDDENNWNYTHRIAGFTWVIGGIGMIFNSFFQIPYIAIVVIVLAAGIPVICSFVYYQRTH